MGLQRKILLVMSFVFLALALGLIELVNRDEKSFVDRLVEDQTTFLAEQYFDSVNTLMISGAMEHRELLREKLKARSDIAEARIVRGPKVVADFGEGFEHEHPKDEFDNEALQGKEHNFFGKAKTGDF